MTRLAALIAFTAVLAACGGTVEESTPESPSRQLAPLAAAPATPPASVEAADGRSAFGLARGELRRYSTLSGEVTRTYPLRGSWRLTAVSATGDWVALQRGRTEVLVLDAETGTETHRVRLDGDFRVETVSAAGDFLFLQQDFVDGSYAVRGYDLAAGRLLPGSLGRKGETVRMQGDPGQVVASPDGRWLLTVYVETTTSTAFVHALNLIERTAICIFLPPCEDCGAEDWTLDLAADGRTLHAFDGAGGRAEIDLRRGLVV
jgi:hypothetical protein